MTKSVMLQFCLCFAVLKLSTEVFYQICIMYICFVL